jgi:hypothetical protein
VHSPISPQDSRYHHRTKDSYVLPAVFTTTKPRGDRPKAKGEIEISKEQAAQLGQGSAFRINVCRIAAMPLTPEFFPDLEGTDHGIRGRSERLANAAFKLFQEIVAKEPELIEVLGPPDAQVTVFGRK